MKTSAPGPTIGVFDSGFGGLTVLRALLLLMPGARFLYLGDTARLPYGSKSKHTVARYALSSARFLLDQGADLLVVACNTASALALDELKLALPIPVVGVIQPGAQAALAFSTQPKNCHPERSRSSQLANRAVEGPAGAGASGPGSEMWVPDEAHVLVLATAATVQSHAYTRELNALGLPATEKACPLLVPLVEEGWTTHPVTAEVLRIYLAEALAEAPNATTLVLGCTHYPLLKPLIERTLAELRHPLHIVDAAQATAQAAAAFLPQQLSTPYCLPPTPCFYATDSIEKFQRLGARFLGQPISEVQLLDLGG